MHQIVLQKNSPHPMRPEEVSLADLVFQGVQDLSRAASGVSSFCGEASQKKSGRENSHLTFGQMVIQARKVLAKTLLFQNGDSPGFDIDIRTPSQRTVRESKSPLIFVSAEERTDPCSQQRIIIISCNKRICGKKISREFFVPDCLSPGDIQKVRAKVFFWLQKIIKVSLSEKREKYFRFTVSHPETTNETALKNYTCALKGSGGVQSQRIALRKALKQEQGFYSAAYKLGFLEMSRGNFKGALRFFRTAAASALYVEDSAEALNLSGMCYAALEEYRAAIEVWRKSLYFWEAGKYSEDQSKVVYNIGCAYERVGQGVMACEYFEQSRKLNSRYLFAANRAFCNLVYEKNYHEAAQVGEDLVKVAPEDPELYYLLGNCYKNDGNRDQAFRWLKEAMDLDPEGVIGRKARVAIFSLPDK